MLRRLNTPRTSKVRLSHFAIINIIRSSNSQKRFFFFCIQPWYQNSTYKGYHLGTLLKLLDLATNNQSDVRISRRCVVKRRVVGPDSSAAGQTKGSEVSFVRRTLRRLRRRDGRRWITRAAVRGHWTAMDAGRGELNVDECVWGVGSRYAVCRIHTIRGGGYAPAVWRCNIFTALPALVVRF